MKKTLTIIGGLVAAGLLVLALLLAWYLHTKQPVRSGNVDLAGLAAKVTVQYDERGVPHIRAENESDMYRALGYVHAQDRLFQMEVMRRLAQGELSEVFGRQTLDTDKLTRTLGIRDYAERRAASMDTSSPAGKAMLAYLDGINQYQNSHKPPIEFNLLHIPRRPFTPKDAIAVSGWMAYSFAAAFKTEPTMTFVRDKLGPDYLKIFTPQWQAQGVVLPGAVATALPDEDWKGLADLASVSREATGLSGLPAFQGSNAWVVAGRLTASGMPLLAGDPHIGFSVPAVWYEAQISSPGFDLYGHFMALNPFAMLGHNATFGWSITMFENDDIDLISERTNPENPAQVWHGGQWVEMTERTQTIAVKDAKPVTLVLRQSPHGPIVNSAFKDSLGKTPIAMWWAFLQTENPLMDAFYALNRADTRAKARQAASNIHAPGLNILWAGAQGDIAWWAAGKIPVRPPGVNPAFILDAAKGEAQKSGFYNFNFNPQEENPPRGYIVSANNDPAAGSGTPVPGYYLLPDRMQQIKERLSHPSEKWNLKNTKALQLDTCNGYGPRVLALALPVLESAVTDENEKAFLEPLQKWDGCYNQDSIAATLFTQFNYELTKAVFEDEMGEVQFNNLLGTHALEHALPVLLADPKSPWWNNVDTPDTEDRIDTMHRAWTNTIEHLKTLHGTTLTDWAWGKNHTLTHQHPLGQNAALGFLFNVGPFEVGGARETPNNMAAPLGPAPWHVKLGPSTRKIIDFGRPDKAEGINPVGQSGVFFDGHYADQAERFALGQYQPMHLGTKDVATHTESTLTLRPRR